MHVEEQHTQRLRGSMEGLDSGWDPLLTCSVLRVHRICKCNLGVARECSGRPVSGSAQLVANASLPDMSRCKCGQPYDNHCTPGPRTSERNKRESIAQPIMIPKGDGASMAQHMRFAVCGPAAEQN